MDNITRFETETYPRIWHLAYDAGVKAREGGLPRNCDLKGQPFCFAPSKGGEEILKAYKSAWEQGWDGYTIPAIFGQMEAIVNQMPLRPLNEEDL